MKQGEYDVYFLSGCGLYQHVDSRRTSIAAALAFASDKHLSGVVLPGSVQEWWGLGRAFSAWEREQDAWQEGRRGAV